MKLLVGLGNPGKKYNETRHNCGFLALDEFKSQASKSLADGAGSKAPISSWTKSENANALYCKVQIKSQEVELIKPQTFINKSGYSVAYAYDKHSPRNEDVYVIHDDLDIALGNFKIQFAKGPKAHNGLISIYKSLGTKNFWHVRIGVENRHQASELRRQTSGEEYVLDKFTKKERGILNGVLEKVVAELTAKLGNN